MHSIFARRVFFPLQERIKGKNTHTVLRELQKSQWLSANRIQELLAGKDRYDSSLAISVARERSWERQVPRLSEWLIPQQNGKRRFWHDQRETANQDQNLITPDTGPTFA